MKKLIALLLACSASLGLLAACGSPMIELATSNHHIEGGFEGHSNLWNAMYKDGGKDVKYGDETKADFITYQMTPAALAITITGEVPPEAPNGIQMLVMAPKDTAFIKTYYHENGNKMAIDDAIDMDTMPANVYESKMSENRLVFVLEYLGNDENGDGTISQAERRLLKNNFKATVAFFNAKGNKLSQESFDVSIQTKQTEA